MSYYYKADEVRALSANNWLFILAALAPEISEAIQKIGRHITCPIHGGKKDFRLFKDAHMTGGGICNSQGCGSHHDGFELLMWLKRCDFKEALLAVGDFVNAEKHYLKPTPNKAQLNPDASKATNRTLVTNQQIQSQDSTPAEKPRFTAKGHIVEFGMDHYKNDVQKEKSFYAKLKNRSNYVKTIWGADIERALKEAGVSTGDLITLNNLGRKAVSITREILNESGDVIGEETVSAHRNTWEVINHSPKPEINLQDHNDSQGTDDVAAGFNDDAVTSGADIAVEEVRAAVPDWVVQAQALAEENAKRREKQGLRAQAYHQKFWDECVSIECQLARPVHLYLESRKVLTRLNEITETDSVRFHNQVAYYDENGSIAGHHPAIVCAIRDSEGEIVTLHRTYLGLDGAKAKVEDARKMMTVPDGLDVNGCSIPMGKPVNGVLGIAEGLETAWSAYKATGIITWSTVNAQLMKTFKMPEGVHTLIIFADKDRSLTGEMAAQILKLRLEAEGYNVFVLMPNAPIPAQAKGIDWNDILCTQGVMGFPPQRMLLNLIKSSL